MTELTTNINKAAKAIFEGKVVAFPTDTVFGLGTNAFMDVAVERLYKIKRRSKDKPFIINIADFKMIKDIVIVQDGHLELLKNFWPGKITFIFKKKRNVLKMVSCGKMTLAVRIPAYRKTISLIEKANCPIVSTSANFEGEPEPKSYSAISDELFDSIDIVLKGDKSYRTGISSTIVDISDKTPRILRVGAPRIVRKLEKFMLESKGWLNGKN